MLNPLYKYEEESNSDFQIQHHLGSFKTPRINSLPLMAQIRKIGIIVVINISDILTWMNIKR